MIHLRRTLRRGLVAMVVGLASLALAWPAVAGPREQARRMHDRLVGVPPLEVELDAMEALVQAGDPVAAARLAMEHPAFYTVSLKNFVTPWTNVDQTVFAPLNDYTATVIGIVRDDLPFDEVLTADLVYVGADGVVGPGYSHTDNAHYEALERQHVDLGDPALLVPTTQSGLPGSQLRTSEAAGVITTRAAAEAFFSAGTNRRMWRFISMNYLCRDLEEMKDITRPVDRIRQDVSRSPGGDSLIFQNHCSGCHGGMDALAGAFAYFEWDADQGRMTHTRGSVTPKHLINAGVFPYGYVTVDNRWDNYWREGPNAALGWGSTEPGGFGAKTLGAEVAGSRAFAVCQVEKVFRHLCFRPPNSPEDATEVERVADLFAVDRSMKGVFAEVAAFCRGD